MNAPFDSSFILCDLCASVVKPFEPQMNVPARTRHISALCPANPFNRRMSTKLRREKPLVHAKIKDSSNSSRISSFQLRVFASSRDIGLTRSREEREG